MIIVLNNKSNLTKEEFIEYYKKLTTLDTSNEKVVLCPTYLHLALATSSNIELGAQNVSTNDMGPYTGEVSAIQLKSYNVKYAIVGHSERRIYQHETSQEISEKIKKLLDQNITPIICIGETNEEKNSPYVEDIIISELKESIKSLSEEEYEKIIIAYEPIWAIGTGIIPNNEEIKAKTSSIKRAFPMCKLLYGGSVNEINISELIKNKDLDGFLIGGISLEVNKLEFILKKLKESI